MKLNDFDILSINLITENKASVSFKVDSTGGKVSGKGLATISNMSIDVGTTAGLATHEIRRRLSGRRYVLQFFAKDVDERQLYSQLVKDLTKNGLYKQIRKSQKNGGVLWELKRVK